MDFRTCFYFMAHSSNFDKLFALTAISCVPEFRHLFVLSSCLTIYTADVLNTVEYHNIPKLWTGQAGWIVQNQIGLL